MASVEGPLSPQIQRPQEPYEKKSMAPKNSSIIKSEVVAQKHLDASNLQEIPKIDDEREYYIKLLMEKKHISYDVAASEYDALI